MWTTRMHLATHVKVLARTSGSGGRTPGISCVLVPTETAGVKAEEYLWSLIMPPDHMHGRLTDVWIPENAYWGELDSGLAIAQSFAHQHRVSQVASSLRVAVCCLNDSVNYARTRKPFSKALAFYQGIQFPFVESTTQIEMLCLLIGKTACEMDRVDHHLLEQSLSDNVSMCNFWANWLVCETADRAVQVHGGLRYSRHKPSELRHRHHWRYRITEGSEVIQMRKISGYLFGFAGSEIPSVH